MGNLIFCLAVVCSPAFSKQITTNFVNFENAPDWLTEKQLEEATSPIRAYLEWDLVRIKVLYHPSVEEFDAITKLPFKLEAFFRQKDSTVHLSPRVTKEKFASVFGHELVHATFYQKYKGAIPPWLEEGLANYIPKKTKADYVWLASQPYVDVTTLSHPSSDASGSRYHYSASTAVVEMIASRCDLKDILRLSVGRKIETYLKTTCEIPDVNAAFQEWIAKKSKL